MPKQKKLDMFVSSASFFFLFLIFVAIFFSTVMNTHVTAMSR